MGSETSDKSGVIVIESSRPSQPEPKSKNEATQKVNEDKEEKKRPCCVCKDTRAARDLCYAEKGFEECYKEIQQHKDCMAAEGFKI